MSKSLNQNPGIVQGATCAHKRVFVQKGLRFNWKEGLKVGERKNEDHIF